MKVPSMIAAELRRLTASRMGIIALIALVCVPILYGGLYLWANQDPYAKFPDVPVALVVDDEGAATPTTGNGCADRRDRQLRRGCRREPHRGQRLRLAARCRPTRPRMRSATAPSTSP